MIMVDLEEAILRKNVPGKYSSWTGEDSDRREEAALDDSCSDDSEDDEFYFKDLPPMTSSSSQQQQQAPTTMPLRSSGNTGVKGVIADYKEAKRDAQLQKAEERLENMKRLQRPTQPAIRPREERNGSEMKQGSIDSDSDDDDIDDDFVKQFRMQRLAQLQNKSNATQQTAKLFGTLSLKTPDEYVELIDNIDPQVFVIVHLYEPSISESRMLHAALDKVAQTMEYAKFIEVYALAANSNLDLISLPAILIYKGGTLVHNMIKFTDGLPKAFTVNDVKESLESVGVV